MKIKNLQLKNFKRFTDLALQDIPENAKLILIIGSNGSGKSSIFDGFELISDMVHRRPPGYPVGFNFSGGKQYSYYHKFPRLLQIDLNFWSGTNIQCIFKTAEGGDIEFNSNLNPNLFYGRSAVRYLPRITRTSIGQAIDIFKDDDRPKYFIDEDKRFENDIDLLIKEVVDKIFKGINTDSSQQLQDIKNFLDKINAAFPRIFGDGNDTRLLFKSFIPPSDGKPSQMIFRKGNSEINYDFLSAGEKEVVNLLFNLFVRNKIYDDTIYFMDEMDTHLNTALQLKLLKEIVENWIPENCQLWTASHSLGFIQYARENNQAAILDFDDYDFDYPKIIIPEPKDNPEIYDIAIDKDFLSKLFVGFDIFFVENTDQIYYSLSNQPKTLFVPEKGRNAVYYKVKAGDYKGIIDREYLSDEDILEITKYYPSLRILKYYSIENYLYHPDNIEEYKTQKGLEFNKEAYKEEIRLAKVKVIQELTIKIATILNSYPFFDDPRFDTKENTNQRRFKNKDENFKNTSLIVGYLTSDDFHTFFKSFSIKDYGKHLSERNNPLSELAQTIWFKKQIESIIK